ncbi:phytase [Hylemonella sp. W303a]|uniref:phytase n=1 Tax=Hylemonella sp. W303a TaxID=3389873 RepID=UPI00396B0D5C
MAPHRHREKKTSLPSTLRARIGGALATTLVCLHAGAATPSHSPPQEVTRALSAAEESSALPASAGGGWLLIETRTVRLLDASGQERAKLALRAEHLDVRAARSADQGALAVVFDNNLQQPLLLNVDARTGRLDIRHRFAPVDFALEAMCLYRDAQQLDHLFLIAKDGLAEQWLLPTSSAAGTPRLLRRLALPPNAERCRGDDTLGQLVIEEAGVGVWAYAADGEGIPQRRLIQAKTSAAGNATLKVTGLPYVLPQGQTEPMARSGDAADDPAIWVHPGDAARSRVFGTNKKQGLLSYDLQGRQTQLIESGRLNNVDIRQNLRIGMGTAPSVQASALDLAVATQRDDNALVVFEIDAQGQAREAARINTSLQDIYGMCLHRTPEGGLHAFANDKSGRFEQIRITRDDSGHYQGHLLRSFRTRSQPEGCVADDATGRLFYGEEKRGIWTLPTDAQAKTPAELVLATGATLVADVEGLAIYRAGSGQAAYLIASSQGNNSYVVLDAQAPYRVRGAFRIGINAQAGIDGASETDGIEVSPVNFGGAHDQGIFVVQDGYKRLPDGAQNFKYVAWRDIAQALGLN